MPLFGCVAGWQGEPSGAEGQRLAWATADELEGYEMPPADVPMIGTLKKLLAECGSAE